jgi:hypothetical protein
VDHEKQNRGEQRSNQQTACRHESSLHEATSCGFFPQVDDEQAEDEGLER